MKAKKENKAAEKKKPEEKEIGKVTHYFDGINVAVVELTAALKKGDKIKLKGATTDFEQKVESMQIEHEPVDKAKKGDAIGMKVADRVRPNDRVYIVG
ncbi:translation elongation factor-like protein [Candidatus Pacearchaeota archaeon]|nr:translation elongation factor-like protein [Candidatus Pacearchaeota archaeon]